MHLHSPTPCPVVQVLSAFVITKPFSMHFIKNLSPHYLIQYSTTPYDLRQFLQGKFEQSDNSTYKSSKIHDKYIVKKKDVCYNNRNTQASHIRSCCCVTYCLLCQRILSILQPQHSDFCQQRTIVIALPHFRFWWFLDFVVSDDWFTCPSETRSPGSKVFIIFERDFALVVTYVSYFRDIK